MNDLRLNGSGASNGHHEKACELGTIFDARCVKATKPILLPRPGAKLPLSVDTVLPHCLWPAEETVLVQLVPGRPDRVIFVGVRVRESHPALIDFLCRNTDVFVWEASDLTGVDPEVISHRLSVNLAVRPI